MAKYEIHVMESPSGVLGNRRNDIYSRETGNKGQILSGTGYKGNIGKGQILSGTGYKGNIGEHGT